MSKIEWTEQTWNPIVGCSKVSAGCQNCYAISQAYRNAAIGQKMENPGRLAYYEGLTEKRGDRVEWTGVVRFVPEALEIPLKRKKPTTWFVNSMSDLFHESVTFEQLFKIASIILATPQHTYQILTKRPERMTKVWVEVLELLQSSINGTMEAPPIIKPLSNVWLGVTIENQEAVSDRAGFLHQLYDQGWKTFYSCEPLLEEVNLHLDRHPVDWVVIGGESGNKARPCNVEHIRSIVKQCRDANVPVFVKQLGSNAYYPMAGKGSDINEFPEDLRVREYPVFKKSQ